MVHSAAFRRYASSRPEIHNIDSYSSLETGRWKPALFADKDASSTTLSALRDGTGLVYYICLRVGRVAEDRIQGGQQLRVVRMILRKF
ncbi:MAG: hypothetical protein R3C01_07360 [Planctomycetaceae bacterium]